MYSISFSFLRKAPARFYKLTGALFTKLFTMLFTKLFTKQFLYAATCLYLSDEITLIMKEYGSILSFFSIAKI